MKKSNHVTNLKCFDQVAAVIGHANAQRELFKVMNSGCDFEDRALDLAFLWENAPQGFDFWLDIDCGINPY